jgi:hypothetical protein
MHSEFCVHGMSHVGWKEEAVVNMWRQLANTDEYINDTLFSKEEIYVILVYDIFKGCDVFIRK